MPTSEQENEALRKKIKELEEALVESQKDLCTQIILDRNMGDEFDSETVFGDLCHLSNIQKEITVIKHTQIGNSPTHVTIATNTEGHIGDSSADMSTGMDRPATTAMSTGTDGIGGTSIGTEIDEELSETDLQGKHNKEMQAINKDFSIKLRKRVDDMSQKDLKKLLDEHRRQVEKLQLQQQSERERLRRCLQERLNQRQNQNNKLSSDMSSASSSSSSSSDDSDSCVNQSKSSKKPTSQSDNYSDTSFCSSDSGSSSDSESENEENAELMNTVTSEIMTNISSMTEKDMKDYMQIARRQREKLKRIRGNEKQRADESLLAILARRREVTDKEGNVFDGDKEEMPADDAGDNGDESGPPHDNAEASQTELFMKDAHTQMQEKINKLNEEINTQIDTSVKQMDEKFVQTLMEVQTNMDDEDNDSTEKAMKELLNRHLKQADELRDRKEEERNRQKENLMKILKAKKERMMEKNRKDGTSSNNNDTEPDNEVDSDAVFKEEVEKDPNVKLANQELKQELEEMETDLFKELKFRQLDNNLDVSEMNELLERYRREQQRMRERKEAEMKRHKDNVLQKLKERQKQKEELDKQLYREIHEKQKTEQLTEADLKAIIDQHLKQTSRLEKIQESEKDRQSRKLQEKLNKKKIIDEEKERKKRERERLEMQAQEEAERRKFEEAELKNQKINDAVKVVKGYHETERQLKVNKRIEKERLEEKLRRKLDTGKKRPSNLPEV
ncbi:unnamed protein product [Owenia fusiformis]|uniref:Uncharacterized protein n=1 Tax=Owenia fusiformis TaxID=6347 RepID=A0A8J1XF84_OWEFU|nr:unnamed protein product [Owenia fusiformis]